MITIFVVNIANERLQIKENILKMTQNSIKKIKILKTKKNFLNKKVGIDIRHILVGYSWVRRRARCDISDTDNPQLIIVVKDYLYMTFVTF